MALQFRWHKVSLDFEQTTWLSRVYPWVIWSLASLFIFYEYILQIAPSVMTTQLMRDFGVDGSWLGNLAACYYYAYFFMQLPVGVILDRLTPRNVIACAVAVCSIGALLFSATASVTVAFLGRLLIGVGASFAIIGTMKLISLWFPAKRFAFVSGLMLSVGMLGAVVGQMPMALLMHWLGWRDAMHALSVFGFLLAVLIWLFVFSPSRKVRVHHQQNHHVGIAASLKTLAKKPQCWLIAIYSGLAFAPITSFAGLWGVPFLVQQYPHVSVTTLASMMSLVFVGLAIASPLSGWLTDYMGKRMPVMYLGTFLGMCSLLGLIYLGRLALWQLGGLLLAFGFFTGCFFPSFAMMKDINCPEHTATAMGFTNMFNALFGALMEPVVGRLLDDHWQHHTRFGARLYDLHNYHHSLWILPGIMLVAFMLLFAIKESYCARI